MIVPIGALSGTIKPLGAVPGILSGTIVSMGVVCATIVTPDTIPLPNYEGSYSVIPRTTNQILDTRNKTMIGDVEIFAIPYSEVSNPQGGSTITIGG